WRRCCRTGARPRCSSTARDLLTVTAHMLRWSTRLTVLSRSKAGIPAGEEDAYLLHRAAVADHLALTVGTPEDQEDAALTADALWAAGDGRTRLPGAGGVPTPREHVRLAYGAWLAAHPQLDPLAPGSWL
ncbi:hypothetical protein, partial [Streptomyces virginiae]